MRAIYRDDPNISAEALGAQFGVSMPTALRIVTGKRWAHVPGAVAAKSKGRGGEASATSRVSASDVMDMRRRFRGGETFGDLAAAFGLGYEQTRRIIRGEAWAQVPGAVPAE